MLDSIYHNFFFMTLKLFWNLIFDMKMFGSQICRINVTLLSVISSYCYPKTCKPLVVYRFNAWHYFTPRPDVICRF